MNKITFIATAHNEELSKRLFVNSLLNQTCKDFKAVVWHNGYNYDIPMWIEDMNNGQYEGAGYIGFKGSPIDSGNWGAANRQQAIDECTTEYIIQTSVQDYWLPQAVEYILKGLEQSPDILLWDSINHIVGPCQIMDAQLQLGKVDWGNFCIKTDIAKKVGIRHGSRYTADWLFLNDCINMGLLNKVHKLPLVLTIHN